MEITMTDEELERIEDGLYMESICSVISTESAIDEWEMYLQAVLFEDMNKQYFIDYILSPAMSQIEPKLNRHIHYDDDFIAEYTQKVIEQIHACAVQGHVEIELTKFPYEFDERKIFFEEHKNIFSSKDQKELEEQLAICERKMEEAKAKTKTMLDDAYEKIFNCIREKLH